MSKRRKPATRRNLLLLVLLLGGVVSLIGAARIYNPNRDVVLLYPVEHEEGRENLPTLRHGAELDG